MKIIGISGNSGAGKDAFADAALEYFESKGLKARKFALADSLKYELDDIISREFGFSAFTSNRDNKNKVRNLLVNYAEIKRKETAGQYWTSKLDDVLADYQFLDVVLVTDIRFDEYPYDELTWLKKKGGKLVNISRFEETPDGYKYYVSPANASELANEARMLRGATMTFQWPDLLPEEILVHVATFLESTQETWNN